MKQLLLTKRTLLALPIAVAVAALLHAQTTDTYKPTVGQAGKDVVWVPTPQELVDTMLDMAKVTPQDLVMDLGSGDGRTVITAAKRGATAMGVEYNPDMVQLSKKNAATERVESKATFVQADLFTVDLSKASVITMFLLPTINLKLRPSLLDLKPGTRIVSNTFDMAEWEPDDRKIIGPDGCTSWCTAMLWIVPAKVQGNWKTGQGNLRITQSFQKISGTLGTTPITGKLTGDQISFTAASTSYTGRVNGNTIQGSNWNASRIE
jgi:methyltransferase family protein